MRATRAAFPDTPVHVDANGAYRDEPEHHAVLRALDECGLLMIEQPFAPRELVLHARAAHELATPICLDESIDEPGDLRAAIALDAGSGRVVWDKEAVRPEEGESETASGLAAQLGGKPVQGSSRLGFKMPPLVAMNSAGGGDWSLATPRMVWTKPSSPETIASRAARKVSS